MQRLIFFPALLIVEADPTDVQGSVLWVAAFVAAFVLNVLVAEARIRATRRKHVPRAYTPESV